LSREKFFKEIFQSLECAIQRAEWKTLAPLSDEGEASFGNFEGMPILPESIRLLEKVRILVGSPSLKKGW